MPLPHVPPDLYEEQIPGNAVLEAAVGKVKGTMDHEHHYQMSLMNLKGMLETFFSAAETASASSSAVPENAGKDGESELRTEDVLSPSAAAVENA